jgi:hypothetical protein
MSTDQGGSDFAKVRFFVSLFNGTCSVMEAGRRDASLKVENEPAERGSAIFPQGQGYFRLNPFRSRALTKT